MKFSIIILISLVLSLYVILTSNAFAWENEKTHPAITEQAVRRSQLGGDYLQNQLGLSNGFNTQLQLPESYQNELIRRASQVRPDPMIWNETELSILEWLKTGSIFEDVPGIRARHHFYDPIRNAGLDNPGLVAELMKFSKLWYPAYWPFDATGASTLDRVRSDDGYWQNEYLNYYNWPYARNLFYSALTEQSKDDRDKTLGAMFVILGHICHLLEDMGVPAHCRNDFVWGHLVGGFYKNVTGSEESFISGGNPFEKWFENQITSGQIPDRFLSGLADPPNPPALSELEDYWDIGICEPSGVAQWQGVDSPPPEKLWGLAECSNYQFLSYSSIFKTSGLQSFPHPAKEHTSVVWYPTGPKMRRQYYRAGYGVPHLARVTYNEMYKNNYVPSYTVEFDTTEDIGVFEDYAERTIPRTIDYATGLINYFFRGKLSIEQTDCNNGTIVITITNKSSNSGVSQILKGGTFELYWDDQDGVRTPVETFTVKDSDDNPWNSSSILEYNHSAKITFALETPPTLDNYTVVYKGAINSEGHPDQTDSDDSQALATTSFYCGELLIDGDMPYASLCECAPWSCYTNCGDLRYIVSIWNVSNKSGSPQNLVDGTFKVYYEDMDGQLIQLTSVTGSLDYCYEWWGWESEPVLQIDLGVISWTPAQRLIVIYKGKMVDSENPTDEYDGMAVGSRDVEGIGPDGGCYCIE